MLRTTLMGAAALIVLGSGSALAQTPDASMPAQPMASGGTMTNVPGGVAADTAGFAPAARASGDGQLVQQSVTVSGTQVNVTSNAPVPNPPAATSSSSPGRGAGRISRAGHGRG